MASSPILAIISAVMIAPNIKETPDTKNAQQNEEKSP
jgi:hypothetical protein